MTNGQLATLTGRLELLTQTLSDVIIRIENPIGLVGEQSETDSEILRLAGTLADLCVDIEERCSPAVRSKVMPLLVAAYEIIDRYGDK